MKKGIMICMAVLVCTIFAGCGGTDTKLPEGFDEETVVSEAKAMIELGESDNYEEFIKHFEANTAATLTEETYQSQYLATVKSKGTFESFGKEAVVGQTDKDTGAKYAGVVIVAKYADGQIQYTIGFDEDMKLVQFLIK